MDTPIKVQQEILRLRKKLAYHSYLYYIKYEPQASDALWDNWAYRLKDLHNQFGTKQGYEDELFSDWDGHTGMHISMLGKKIAEDPYETWEEI